MRKYKMSKDFDDDAIVAGVDTYVFSFTDCQCTVAQAYPELDLSHILAPREEEK